MKKLVLPISFAFVLAACGTDGELTSEEPMEEPQATSADEPVSSEEPAAEDDREIIATLEQTAEPIARNEAAEAVRDMEGFTSGAFGEPTDELAEELAVQQIEAEAAHQAVTDVYGDFSTAGIFYIATLQSGAEEPAVWIGIEEPDERVDELVSILQEQVDAGEILAAPIHIFDSAHAEADLNAAADQVGRKMNELALAHPNTAVSFSVAPDVKTGEIQVGHNFLTEEQQQELIAAFPEQEIVIEQSGMMAPMPGEATVAYPEPATVSELSDKGAYLVDLEDDRFLAVAAKAQDFSENGGQEEFYSAIWYDFPDAAEQLEIGQRVQVEASGPIMESYPGQGTAVFVEVLPAYKPENADLTETEVVRGALEGVSSESFEVPAVQSVAYNADTDNWAVVLQIGETEMEQIIPDE